MQKNFEFNEALERLKGFEKFTSGIQLNDSGHEGLIINDNKNFEI